MSAIFILIRFLSYFFSVKCPGPAGTQNFLNSKLDQKKKKKNRTTEKKIISKGMS